MSLLWSNFLHCLSSVGKCAKTSVGDLDGVPVKQGMEDVTRRDGSVEDLEELCPDIAGHPGIPRRVKPPDLPLPAPVLLASFFVLVVERVDVLLLIFKIKGVAAGSEGFLIFWLAFIEHSLITRQNI